MALETCTICGRLTDTGVFVGHDRHRRDVVGR
jgi:hypothetical protein